jgi:hypothetical protein
MEILRDILSRFRKPESSFKPVINSLEQLGAEDALKQADLLRTSERRRLANVFIDEMLGEIEEGREITTESLVQRFQAFRKRNPFKEDEYHGYLTLGLVWSMVDERHFLEWQKYLKERGGLEDENYRSSTGEILDLLYEMADEQDVEPYELSGIE